MDLSRRFFLIGASSTVVATVVAPKLLLPPSLLSAKPEIIRDWLPLDGRIIFKEQYPELVNFLCDSQQWRVPGGAYSKRALTNDDGMVIGAVLPGFSEKTFDEPLLKKLAKDEWQGFDMFISSRDTITPSGLIIPLGTLLDKVPS